MNKTLLLTFSLIFISLSLFSQTSTQAELEKELTVELEELEKVLAHDTKTYNTYKGLAISGYSLTGASLGLMILDTLVATPDEVANSANKFGNLTWSSIPFLVIGTAFSVAFHILEEEANEEKLITEGKVYDIRSELDAIQLARQELLEPSDENEATE